MRRSLIVLFMSSFLLAAVSYIHAKQKDEDASKLIGTWRLVSGKYNGQVADLGKLVELKHVTDSEFTWLRYDKDTKKVSQAAGGSYSVKSGMYSEKPVTALARTSNKFAATSIPSLGRSRGINGIRMASWRMSTSRSKRYGKASSRSCGSLKSMPARLGFARLLTLRSIF